MVATKSFTAEADLQANTCLKIGLGRETFSCNHKGVRLILWKALQSGRALFRLEDYYIVHVVKVKWSVAFIAFERWMFSWFSPHTRLQYLKISSTSFYCPTVKGTKHTKKCWSSENRQFRDAPVGAAGVQPGLTGLFLSYHWHYSLQEQKKTGLLGKISRNSGLIR